MTKDKMLLGVVALLSSLAEAPPGDGAPSGYLYEAMMSEFTLTEFLAVQSVLVQSRLAALNGQVLCLTPAGREAAAKAEALLEACQA